jgi:hypothetical protein
MDNPRFDALTRSFAIPTRRGLFSAFGAALAALLAPGPLRVVSGKKKKRRKKRPVSPPVVSPPAAPPVSPPPPPPGCPDGTRDCGSLGCISNVLCCTDADCAPGGTCNATTGVCSCVGGLKTCPGAPGFCVQCCTGDECASGAECRDRACRCPTTTPTGPCGCSAATSSLIFCGPGLSCACNLDMEHSTPGNLVMRCGVLQAGSCTGCTSAISCPSPSQQFCGACNFNPSSGGTCTNLCPGVP